MKYIAEYQREALKTNNPNADTLLMTAMGLAGEVGEYVELIKKFRFHSRGLDNYQAADELGDILWYLAVASNAIGISLEEIAQRNITKLRIRFPQGFQDGPGRDRME